MMCVYTPRPSYNVLGFIIEMGKMQVNINFVPI